MQHVKTLLPVLLLAPTVITLGGRAQAAPFDQSFLDSMTPHHMMATQMAQIAAQKARYPEVKALAQNIIRDQNKEIAQMRTWRKSWYGSAQAPVGTMHHRMSGGNTMSGMTMGTNKMMSSGMMMGLPLKMEMDMGRLRRAQGAQVDKLFLSMMIPHHASAIVMADEATRESRHPQLQNLAHRIIDAQAKEIGDMRMMYVRHFGKM